VRRQTYDYLPSRSISLSDDQQYQIILLGNRDTCVCEQLAEGHYILAVEWPGVEFATFLVARQRPNYHHSNLQATVISIWTPVSAGIKYN